MVRLNERAVPGCWSKWCSLKKPDNYLCEPVNSGCRKVFQGKSRNMFGDMMGQMQEMQAKMREKLRTIEVTGTAGDGLVAVTANGAREILNIKIDPSLLGDAEGLEDLLLVATNRALELAAEKEASEGQSLLGDMLPGGLGGLFG